MIRIIDVTVPLSADLPGYPGDPPFELRFDARLADGDVSNTSRLSLGSHAGTHVDAPFHFLVDGASVDRLPLDVLVGRARVVEVSARERIERADLETLDLRDDLRLLLKTRMSGLLRKPPLYRDWVHLAPEAARYLVDAGLKLVGIDYVSVDPHGSTDFPAHQILLEAGVVIVEGLDLSEAEPADYDMTCLPLLVAGADAAPARVVLRRRS
jgi:arylformamidase